MDISKSERIRQLWLSDRSLQPQQIITVLQEEGLSVSSNLIEVVRHRLKREQLKRKFVVLSHILQADLSRTTEYIISECWKQWIDATEEDVEQMRFNAVQLRLFGLVRQHGPEEAIALLERDGVTASPEIRSEANRIHGDQLAAAQLSQMIQDLVMDDKLALNDIVIELERRGFDAIAIKKKEIKKAAIAQTLSYSNMSFQEVMRSLLQRGFSLEHGDRTHILLTLQKRDVDS